MTLECSDCGNLREGNCLLLCMRYDGVVALFVRPRRGRAAPGLPLD